MEPNRNRRTGTATTEPRRTEPHRNRTAGEPWKPNREKVPLSLSLPAQGIGQGSSRSLSLSLCLSLSLSVSLCLSLALSGALSRSLSFCLRLCPTFHQDALSLALAVFLSLSLSLSVAFFRSLSRSLVSLSLRLRNHPLFGFPARTRPKCGTGRGLAKRQMKPILGGWGGPGNRPKAQECLQPKNNKCLGPAKGQNPLFWGGLGGWYQAKNKAQFRGLGRVHGKG